MKVIVDQDVCVASGQCVLAAADVFDQQDNDGMVVVLTEHPPTEREAAVREAASRCPALAIKVER